MANGPTAQRRRLGKLLREFRETADIKGDVAGKHVDRSAPWLSHLEAGRVGIRIKMLDELLDLYGITGRPERKELHALATGGRERGWWSDYASVLSKQYSTYVGYEDDAVELFIYETLVVDGLLQTEEYATAVVKASSPMDSATAITKRVQVRLNRQQRLVGDDPLRLVVVMDEAVLHRVIGGDLDIHRRQLERLLDIARNHAHVRVQILPFEHAMFPGMVSAFKIMKFPKDPDIVYVETLTGDRYENQPAADRYTLAAGELRAAALSDTASIERMEEVLARMAKITRRHHGADRFEMAEEH
ncbi:MAG: helix-turn-helix transcriptional regulator [Actinocatenispora sp.]